MARAPNIPPTPDDDWYRAEEDQGEVFTRNDPIALFEEWFLLASTREPSDANAMALATAGADGQPDVRMVLLKDFGADGLTFFTHATSAKGRQLADNPRACALFHWKSIRRQVRFRGSVGRASAAEADAYFAERARSAQVGAWASRQSETLADRTALLAATKAVEARFQGGDVPRPADWVGFRLAPLAAEFWVNRPYRLHDRLLFERSAPGDPWTSRRLFP